MQRSIAFLFGLRGRVDRRQYAAAGIGLLLLKWLVDSAVMLAFTGAAWSPLSYGSLPLLGQFPGAHGSGPPALWGVVALCAVPFIWAGVALTMRRCVDAGLSPTWALLFFVPFVNYLVMIGLCVWPSAPAIVETPDTPGDLPARAQALFVGALSGVAVLVGATVLSVFVLESYGAALFLGAPFVSGYTSASTLRRLRPTATSTQCAGVATLSLLAGGTAMLLFAWEGVFCLAMAFMPASVLSLLGAWMGARGTGPSMRNVSVAMLLAWPLLMAVEAQHNEPEVRELLSVIEVDAPIERVWQHVISFKEIEGEPEWYFRSGIAYPLRARIEGSGVGAIRYCEFSTGPFVEPITAWEAPHRLAFSVASQPPPMTELSPYREVFAPHLEGNLKSHHGEFRLSQLPATNGHTRRTRIEARTWYSIDMAPAMYWQLWSDAIIHAIHMRVLEHIARESQNASATESFPFPSP